ncbi:MAG: SNF2 helicase associated domain-containing protein, partial [Clostridium sp.]
MIIEDLENIILSNTSELTLSNGDRYFRRGLVKEVSTDIHGGLLDLFGTVQSEYNNEIFNTLLEIDLNCLLITETQCECDDFNRVSKNKDIYLCKHIVAVFKRYHNVILSRHNGVNSENINSDVIMEPSEILLKSLDNNFKTKERVKIEVTLTKIRSQRRENYEAEFKIGINKLYVLKNLESFIKAKNSGEELKYGRDFNYNSDKYYFSNDDEKIVEFIEEYVSINESLRGNSLSGTVYRVVNGKSLMILPDALKRFLVCVKHNKIKFVLDTKNIEQLKETNTSVIIGDMPLSFGLEKKKESIVLKSNEEMPLQLNLKGDVFLYMDNIYIPSIEQYKGLKLFYEILSQNKEIEFKNDKANDVFNKVLPQL